MEADFQESVGGDGMIDNVETFVEKVCDEICHWPHVCTQDELDIRCESCILNALLEVTE